MVKPLFTLMWLNWDELTTNLELAFFNDTPMVGVMNDSLLYM